MLGFAAIPKPLTQLLEKDVDLQWDRTEQEAFELIKAALLSDKVITHYEPDKELVVHTDASGDGIGALFLQGGKIVACASRRLNVHEERYSESDMEGLVVVYGPENSVICAQPNENVGVGEYRLDTTTLNLTPV